MKQRSTKLPPRLSDVIADNDPHAADAWIRTRSKPSIADDVLIELEQEANAATDDRSLEGTAKLFRLRMLLEQFLRRGRNRAPGSAGGHGSELAVSAPPIGQLPEYRLVQLLRMLEEDAVGPKIAGLQKPEAVFARVVNFRGCRLSENGHHAEAIDHFTAALGLENTFVPAYCNRARSWIELGEISRAAEDCRRVTELDPDYEPGRETVALVECLARFQSEKGGSLLELAHNHGVLELLRRYDRPRLPGELLEVAMGKRGVSMVAAEAPRDQTRTAREWNHEGVLAGRRGEYEAAASAFTKAIEVDPSFADAWFNRGKTFKLWGRTNEAIQDFQQAVRLDPDNDDAHVLLEETLEPSETEWQTALQVDGGVQSDENRSREAAARIPAYKTLPPRCSIELKGLEGAALADPHVSCPVELVDLCRDILAIGRPCSTRRYDGMAPRVYAVNQRRGADGLRKGGKHSAARSLYRVALRVLLHERRDTDAELVMALNGLGITYLALATDHLRADLIETRNNARGKSIPFMFHHIALRKSALRLARNAKACHVLALDQVARLSNVSSQANQIANLARVERFLGNSDTAHRYFHWAVSVHEALDEQDAADIDRHLLSELGPILTRVTCVGDNA